jgi:EAL domain-containing protein (putative c-di-GMP-specific phosphodiesterase class I)
LSCLREEDYVAHADPDTPDDILARLGGDEFIVLLSNIENQHAPGQVGQRLIRALSEPFTVNDHEFYIGASIGITMFPDDGEAADELIKNADIAMYHSKQQGKNTYHYFQGSMNVTAHQRMALENKLRKALEQNQFMLEFQPQYDAASGKVVGIEALARWRDSEGNIIPPSAFIPVAEDSGLILSIGEWVIREACRQNKAWQDAGLAKVPVAVNVSNVQFSRQDLVTVIADALRSSRLDAKYLEIEITESSIMTRPDRALKIIDTIKSFGVNLSLDDFGTGYSSLSYLRQFPIDTLKIDRGFIRNITTDRQDAEIVSAIIAMAHSLNLKVVAEGIETGEQVEVMGRMKCDILQGYFLGRPANAEIIQRLLGANNGMDPLEQHA